MPSYIVLSKWTPQGLQNVKQSPTRLDSARKEYEAAGVKLKDFYMVTGQYDMVAILDAPDDVTLAKAILSSTSPGSITTQTCRAFTRRRVSADHWWTGLKCRAVSVVNLSYRLAAAAAHLATSRKL